MALHHSLGAFHLPGPACIKHSIRQKRCANLPVPHSEQ